MIIEGNEYASVLECMKIQRLLDINQTTDGGFVLTGHDNLMYLNQPQLAALGRELIALAGGQLERDLADLRAEIDKTYKAWCGRDFAHLPLCEAVGRAMESLRAERAELRERLDRASECVSKMLMHLGGNAINTERGEGVKGHSDLRRCEDCDEMPDDGTCDKCGDSILTTKDSFVAKRGEGVKG